MRKYDDIYLNYGFVVSPVSEGAAQPQCVLCCIALSNESMKNSKLIRHVRRNVVSTRISQEHFFFKRKAKELRSAQIWLNATIPMNKKMLKISYNVAQKICQQKMVHTIWEKLIMHCATEIVREIQWDKKDKALTKIPVWNDTVKTRISSLSDDILEQRTARLRDNDVAIQMNESTDVSKISHLLAFVLYVLESPTGRMK